MVCVLSDFYYFFPDFENRTTQKLVATALTAHYQLHVHVSYSLAKPRGSSSSNINRELGHFDQVKHKSLVTFPSSGLYMS